MKKVFVLMILLLFLTGCGDGDLVGQAADVVKEDAEEPDTLDAAETEATEADTAEETETEAIEEESSKPQAKPETTGETTYDEQELRTTGQKFLDVVKDLLEAGEYGHVFYTFSQDLQDANKIEDFVYTNWKTEISEFSGGFTVEYGDLAQTGDTQFNVPVVFVEVVEEGDPKKVDQGTVVIGVVDGKWVIDNFEGLLSKTVEDVCQSDNKESMQGCFYSFATTYKRADYCGRTGSQYGTCVKTLGVEPVLADWELVCNDLERVADQNECFYDLAVNFDESDPCNKITNTKRQFRCMGVKAGQKGDLVYCEDPGQLVANDAMDFTSQCALGFAEVTRDEAACDIMPRKGVYASLVAKCQNIVDGE